MSTVRELHNQAMKLAQLAQVARLQGNYRRAEELARQAYGYEAQAADLVPNNNSSEPTRSILYRSAASLAYQSQDLPAVQRLITKGLAGYPPSQIERELKELQRTVQLALHHRSRETTIESVKPSHEKRLSLQVGFATV